MKKRLWVGGLILSLSGWAAEAMAQEGPWRPVSSGPVPITLAPTELKPCPTPAATLGRPVAVPGDPRFEPAFTPTPGLLPASYQPSMLSTGSAAPSARDIPGGDSLPTWTDVDGEKPRQSTMAGAFASERLPVVATEAPVKATLQSIAHLATAPTTSVVKAANALVTGDVITSSAVMSEPVTPARGGWSTPLPTMHPAVSNAESNTGYNYGFPPHSGPDTDNCQVYGSAEYLLWWVNKDSVPPLVTTSNNGGNGFLGQPGTTVLLDGSLNDDPRSGFRGNIGLWLDNCSEEAIEVGGFFLGQRSRNFAADSTQYPTLARPFFAVNTGTESAETVASPGISTGRITVSTPSDLWGLDANLRCNICCSCDYRFDLTSGFRYLNLNEGVTITENIQGLAGAPAPFTNAQISVLDSFTTRNQFYGAQIGANSQWKRDAWTLDLHGKLALGATTQQLNIFGNETITSPAGVTTSYPGGLLALSSNIGNYHKTKFSVVPEVGMNLGYQLTDNVRLYAGYNFMYWTNVIRPGAQIDRNLDVTKIPNFNNTATPTGPANNPSVLFKESNLWAQGIVVGLDIRY